MKKTLLVFPALLAASCATPYTPDQLRTKETKELCEIYSRNQSQPVREELIKRNAFHRSEWRSIDRNIVTPGMSETAVICSWGNPRQTRSTSTAYGKSNSWMYQSCSSCKLRIVVTDGSSVVLVQD